MKQSITFTEEFYRAVESYRIKHGIKSWAQAVVHLATIGMNFEGQAVGKWGGDRRSGKGKEDESR